MPSLRTRLAVLALLPFLAACQRTEVNGIGSYTGDATQPPQLDVSEVTCDVGEWGWVRASGTVQNPTDSTATYQVMVAFERDGVRLADGGDWIPDLAPGQTAAFTAREYLSDDAASMDSCAVLTVNRWKANQAPEPEAAADS